MEEDEDEKELKHQQATEDSPEMARPGKSLGDIVAISLSGTGAKIVSFTINPADH